MTKQKALQYLWDAMICLAQDIQEDREITEEEDEEIEKQVIKRIGISEKEFHWLFEHAYPCV